MSTLQAISRTSAVLVISALLSSCAMLGEAGWQEPTARVLSSRLVALTPTTARIDTQIEVNNPNLYAIALGALDYELSVNRSRLLTGEQDRSTNIAAGASQTISLPVDIVFSDVLDLLGSLSQRDSIAYQLKAGMGFDIPVIGRVRVPVTTDGEVPIPKLPQISVSGLKADRLSLTSADLTLTLAMENPNVFGLLIDQFAYEFALDNNAVASGSVQQRVRMDEKGQALMQVPITLSFLDAGMALYQAFLSGNSLDYGLAFESRIGTTLPMMEAFPFSTVQDGRVQLRR
ncbi:MAG: LEA type 2 family protein [Natronospirillum sp.]